MVAKIIRSLVQNGLSLSEQCLGGRTGILLGECVPLLREGGHTILP